LISALITVLRLVVATVITTGPTRALLVSLITALTIPIVPTILLTIRYVYY